MNKWTTHLPPKILYYYFLRVVMGGQLRHSTCWAKVLLLNCTLNSNSLYFALFFLGGDDIFFNAAPGRNVLVNEKSEFGA